jgi:hypothetical protein
MDSYNVVDYFSFLSIAPALVWLVIFTVVGFFIRNNNRDKPHYKYYLWNLYAKLGFSLLFALFYLLYYGGGDTTAYYDGAVVLNNLFFEYPDRYLHVMTSDFDNSHYTLYYDMRTGYPPGWIFREREGFFVAKLMSFISFFTLKSYLAMTFIMAYFTSVVSWKLFELVRSFNMNNEKLLAFGVLLLPSVNFWCTGVSKDTVVFIATIILVYNVFKIISKEQKSTLLNYIIALLAAFIIFKIRGFILAAIALPLLFSLSTKLVRLLGGGDIFVLVFRSVVLIGGLAYAGQSLINNSEENFIEQNAYIQQAAIIQQDFAENVIYGTKKYSIGEIEFSPIGLVKAAPLAIIAGMYRPFPWESISPTLLMNGIESSIFLYFTFLLFRKDFRRKWRKIRTDEFFVFCLIFILVIGFMTGLTSGLFGVLVRLRSILLPFLFIILTIEFKSIDEK